MNIASDHNLPNAVGLGLRAPLHQAALATPNAAAFWEVHPENYFAPSPAHELLLRIAESTPISLHGVSLNLGGLDPLDMAHLAQFRRLSEQVEAAACSEHLAWTHSNGVYLNDLLPLPMTEAAMIHIVDRIDQAQEALGRSLLIENPSSYLQYADAQYSEAGFLAEMSKRSGCGLLLDVNNLYLSAVNHDWLLAEYLADYPFSRIEEIHVAGHSEASIDGERVLIDSHDSAVIDSVWALLSTVLQRSGPRPILLERDDKIPALEVLLAESQQAVIRLEACCADASTIA